MAAKRKNVQYFEIPDGELTHIVRWERFRFRKKLIIRIDQDEFELPWGKRDEIFRLGEEQAILHVAGNGKVSIQLRDGIVEESEMPLP